MYRDPLFSKETWTRTGIGCYVSSCGGAARPVYRQTDQRRKTMTSVAALTCLIGRGQTAYHGFSTVIYDIYSHVYSYSYCGVDAYHYIYLPIYLNYIRAFCHAADSF